MTDLSRYAAGWVIIMERAQSSSYQKLADRHAAWFAEHEGWQAPKFMSDELQDFRVEEKEEEPHEPALD